MRLLIPLLLLLSLSIQAKYLDTETCKECHEDIHYEHTKSMHHKSSIFSDEVHQKMKNAANKTKYSCAICHTPGAKNLRNLMTGAEQPDFKDVRQTDGVSCYYCHQIKQIYHAKTYNINISSATNVDKPTFYGNLKNADDSDKHHAEVNKIYKNSEVCMACHSHKLNKNEFEVCNTKNQHDATSDCIGCHMPKAPGGNEKFNKKGRDEYATHSFLGIHSLEMVKKAVKLELSYKDGIIELIINNKMGHSIITHPMRLKFAKTVALRDGKVIWSNFKESPLEDKEATFIIVFADADGKKTLPNKASTYKINQNLKANGSKTIHYDVGKLQKGDEIKTTWMSYPVNPKIAQKLGITDKEVSKPIIGIEEAIYIY